MKKWISFVLLAAMVLSLSACGGNVTVVENGSSTVEIRHTGKTIEGEITAASVFSEGLAFVRMNENKETAYSCIDKEGHIVFELDLAKDLDINGDIYARFVNGHALIGGVICDTTGKITYPEDVGATTFYDTAFSGGYILAEKVTSDYSSTKKELGVMDMDFHWVVQPSESLYAACSTEYARILGGTGGDFYSDGFIFFRGSKNYLNIQTGAVSESCDVKQPSSTWQKYKTHFEDSKDNTILDISHYQNVERIGNFVNKRAPILFHNEAAKTYYCSLMDEEGNLLFEPMEIKNIPTVSSCVCDGENIVVSGSDMINGDQFEVFQCYNDKGELVGEFNTQVLGKNKVNTCDIGDGVIVVRSPSGPYSRSFYYFRPDFTPLF